MTLAVEEFLRRFLLHLLPRGFMRIRNFGFLANRQRAKTPSTMFPIAPAIRSARCKHQLAGRAPHSLTMELSALRRNHPRCRASLRRATAPPISATSQPVHCMNPYPQPRISLLLRCAHWFCVSRLSKRTMVVRLRLSHTPPHAPSLCDPLLKPKHPDRNGKLANDQDWLIQIQIP